jgi:hypothetical protein
VSSLEQAGVTVVRHPENMRWGEPVGCVLDADGNEIQSQSPGLRRSECPLWPDRVRLLEIRPAPIGRAEDHPAALTCLQLFTLPQSPIGTVSRWRDRFPCAAFGLVLTLGAYWRSVNVQTERASSLAPRNVAMGRGRGVGP